MYHVLVHILPRELLTRALKEILNDDYDHYDGDAADDDREIDGLEVHRQARKGVCVRRSNAICFLLVSCESKTSKAARTFCSPFKYTPKQIEEETRTINENVS